MDHSVHTFALIGSSLQIYLFTPLSHSSSVVQASMALSVINFRMHHGNAMEQITFSGNGLKLLDLKKEILDKKEISRSLDFDLKIVDENGKG